MHVNYQLTESDFRCGIRAYRNKNVWSRWACRFGMAASISFFVVTLAMLIASEKDRNIVKNIAPLVIAVALWNLWLWVGPYFAARSQFRGSRTAQGPKILQVSPTELSFQSELGNSHLQWSGFVTWVEEKQVFALFTNPRVFVIVPKRAFSLEQVAEFREMLRQNVR